MFERRLRLFLMFVFLGGFLLALRAAKVQVVDRDEWIAQANSSAERVSYTPAKRGDLLDFKGRVLATDVPSFEAAVNFRVIDKAPELTWLREEARRRARKLEGWSSADEKGRAALLDQEERGVQRDLDAMWAILASVSGQSMKEVDARRDDIVEDVVGRKLKSYRERQYNAAIEEYKAAGQTPWYIRWIAGDRPVPEWETFEKKTIDDQVAYHTILPDITQDQYNQLALALDKFPQMRNERNELVSVVRLRASVRRNYPYQDVACQVIGHVGVVTGDDRKSDPNKEDERRSYSLNDRIGREGLESIAEPLLRGTRGMRVNDRRGAALRTAEAISGKDVHTTIDIELQRAIQNAFKSVDFVSSENPPDPNDPNHKLIDHLSMTGGAVVFDVKTGQVRALVSVPTFDLNRFDELYHQLVADDLNRPMANRALTDAIEPGSAVKPIVGLGVCTQKLSTPAETIECTGFPIINGKKYDRPRCWTESMFGKRGLGAHHQIPSAKPHPTGFLNLAEAIERSCNVYFETQGNKLGIEGLSYWMRKFGYGRITGIGLPESRGVVPSMGSIDQASRQSAAWYASIGQGHVNVTPIQVANEMATIARDGIWIRPQLLVDKLPPTTQPEEIDIPERVDLQLDSAALKAVHEGMINVVNSLAGTGTQVKRDDVLVAAKTGSATASPLIRYFRDADGNVLRDENDKIRYEIVPYGSRAHPNPEVPWYRLNGFDDVTGKAKGTHSWVTGYAPADNPQIAFAVYVEYGGSGGIGAGSVVRKLLDAAIAEGYVTAKRPDAPKPPPTLARPAEEGPAEPEN